jgi:Protein of unknown function (DUF3102)
MPAVTATALADNTASDQLSALSELARDIRALTKMARDSIIEVGRKLIAAKAQVAHGEWLPWLDREFGWNERTARRYMQVSEAFAIKSDTVSDFTGLTIDASALYALASPKVPEDARDKAIEIAKAGTRVTRPVALRLIEAAEPVPVEDTDTDVIGATEDANDDAFPDLPPIPNDANWQETLREWVDRQRHKSILLKDVTNRFAETIPLHHAIRRWHFDFEERGSALEARNYALLASLLSLGVKFSPPLERGLYPASPETEFTVPPRRRRRR